MKHGIVKPTCTHRILLLSKPRPQVDNNDILLMVGFNYNLTDDKQYVHLINLRHCTHLIGVQKSVKSADFFDTMILSLHKTASKLQLGIEF